MTMHCRKVDLIDHFIDPSAGAWNGVAPTSVDMAAAPLGMQPKAYIQASWADRPYGLCDTISVASVHDGKRLALFLRWHDATEDRGEGEGFSDSAAIAMPLRGRPPLMEMGAPDAPIHILQWRARKDEIRSVTASGLGSSRPGPTLGLSVRSLWRDNIWRIVMVRDLIAPGEGLTLTPGTPAAIGFAVWDGANQERAGIKAMSIDWIDFVLAP